MKRIACVIALTALQGCNARQHQDDGRSADDMARARMERVEPAPERVTAPVSHPVQTSQYPFELYGWQVRVAADTEPQIVVLGRGLQEARRLVIDGIEVPLAAAADGRSATGRYPEQAPADAPIAIDVGRFRAELPERFSPAKLRGEIPVVHGCRYSREMVRVPERIPDIGGRSVNALRFTCTMTGFEPRNAPVTVFFGSFDVPNDQIAESEGSIAGVVYHPERLEAGVPVLIDFGSGLRSLAPEPLVLP